MIEQEISACMPHYVMGKQGAKIFINDKSIFESDNYIKNHFDKFPYKKAKIMVGAWLSEFQSRFQSIKTIEELEKLGFSLISMPCQFPWRSGQRVQLYLAKKPKSLTHVVLNSIPLSHIIKYDVQYGFIQLIGPNAFYGGLSRVINIKSGIQGMQPKGTIIEIDEIPLLITKDNELVCLPKSHDTYVNGIVGERRKGKSVSLHRLLNEYHHNWKEFCMVVNDVELETGLWCKLWKGDSIFLTRLKKINQYTCSVPLVYLQPIEKSVTNVMRGETSGHMVSLGFQDIMNNWEAVFEGGIKDMGKSLEYMKGLMYDNNGDAKPDGLLFCKDMDEIQFVIENADFGKATGMKLKMQNYIRNIFQSNVMNVNTGIPSKWKAVYDSGKEIVDYPWTLLMLNNTIPVFQSSKLRGTPFHYIWMRKLLESTYYNQKKNPLFFDGSLRVNLFIDEIEDLLKNSTTSNILNTIVKESGPANIGVTWVAQNYNSMPNNFKLQTTNLIAFHQVKKGAVDICEDYHVDKSWGDRLRHLKKFECVLFTKEHYKVYNINNGKSYESEGPFFGQIIPPTSQHAKPTDLPPGSIDLEEYKKLWLNKNL